MRKHFIAALVIIIFLLFWHLAQAGEPKKENLTSKRLAITALLVNNACEGAEQGNNWANGNSKWSWYNKDTAHAFYFTKRGAQVVSVLAAANWHPKQKLFGWKTANQFIYITALQSFTLNRFMRKVQSGNWFPDEKEHSWYLDFGWLRLEVQGRNEQQYFLLGIGVIGLLIDSFF